ncbi:MAG TPA: indole-3-glycerol phosphate synthase TrpC [bacterium]|nr:indole-3-glycerol phosphate synthase TrpC [bacterium]
MNKQLPGTFLDRVVQAKRDEVEYRKKRICLNRIRWNAPARDFKSALEKPGLAAIAEIKRQSPSAGLLRQSFEPAKIARSYEANGASAISVLTDTPLFGGHIRDVQTVKTACALPVLRKEFIVDAYQIHESRAIGADAVLLIARILDPKQLRDYVQMAADLGLSILVEVHSADEMQSAVDAGARMIGINNRDLDTLTVDLNRCLDLIRLIPGDCLSVAESGIGTRKHVRRVEEAGFDAMLIGGSLMREPDPGEKLAELLESRTRRVSL